MGVGGTIKYHPSGRLCCIFVSLFVSLAIDRFFCRAANKRNEIDDFNTLNCLVVGGGWLRVGG